MFQVSLKMTFLKFGHTSQIMYSSQIFYYVKIVERLK